MTAYPIQPEKLLSRRGIEPQPTASTPESAEASNNSPEAKDGANTSAPVESPATPATAGGKTTARAKKANAGGATSRRSATRKNTRRGKTSAPPFEPDDRPITTAPPPVLNACIDMKLAGALEIYYMRGGSQLTTAQHDIQLDSGLWVLARFRNDPHEPEPMDGLISEYRRS